MSQTIPLTALAQYPPHLVNARTGTDGDPSVATLALRALDRFDLDHRASLADAVLTEMRQWSAPQRALDAAEALRVPGSYAVVTGQQAGLASGPLYTLYKALGAVREARELEARYPEHRFVPLFWIEADDHDFDEVRRITVLDRAGLARNVAYDDGDRSPRHVGDRRIDREAFGAFQSSLRETMMETEFTPEVYELLGAAYGIDDATLASGFARSLYALLGDVPLVVVSSRNPRLKRLARDVFEREARDPDALFNALVERTAQLSAEGHATPITPKRGGLFMTHEGTRRALDADGDGYTLRDVATRFTSDELAELARSAPESLSPNVALRPIVQDAILPTAIYLGGPSEVAYLEQLTSAYAAFDLEPPVFGTRPFVLLLEPKAKRAIEGAGLSIERMLREDFNVAAFVVDDAVEREIEGARDRAHASIRAAMAEFEALTKQIDPTLEKALGATGAGAEKGIEEFSKRLRSALKRRSQTEIDRLESARELLLPGGRLQERSLNALYYVNKFGLARVRAALDRVEARAGVLQVLEL
jgi:bacillithiol synthase